MLAWMGRAYSQVLEKNHTFCHQGNLNTLPLLFLKSFCFNQGFPSKTKTFKSKKSLNKKSCINSNGIRIQGNELKENLHRMSTELFPYVFYVCMYEQLWMDGDLTYLIPK